jgi:hypothetical protein
LCLCHKYTLQYVMKKMFICFLVAYRYANTYEYQYVYDYNNYLCSISKQHLSSNFDYNLFSFFSFQVLLYIQHFRTTIFLLLSEENLKPVYF